MVRLGQAPHHYGAQFRHHIGLVILAKATLGFAQVHLTPYASASYEHESNVFYKWGGSAAAGQSAAPLEADLLRKVRAGLDMELSWSGQKLSAKGEVRRTDYQRLRYLSHTGALLEGAFNWALKRSVDGSLGYRHERRMVPFSDLGDIRALFLENEEVGTASVNLRSAVGWSLENRVSLRNLASPRPGVPELNLRETSVHEALRRVLREVSFGVDAEYLDGEFSSAGQRNPHYQQRSVLLAAEHAIAGFSTYACAVGYTRRVGENGASVSAVTGTLSYQRQFTGKTSGTVQITRAINSYVTNVSSEVDTGAAVQVTWRATPRLQLTPGISYLNSKFSQQLSDSGSGRRDRYQVITLDLRYQVLRWLSLHPYGRRDMRSSSEARFGFGANAVGLELLIEEPR